MSAPEVAKWQQKYRVQWDATDGRNGGAQRTVWERWKDLMEEQRKKIKELWPWSSTWRIPLSESAFLWSGLGRRTSASQERSCGSCAATLSTRGVWNSKDVCGSVPDHFRHPARVEVELLAFTHCIAGCIE